MILADKILSLRKKSGWSQEELADKLNVSRQSISKWEGAIAIPDINKIIEMAKIFGVTTDYLLKDDVEETIFSNDDDSKVRKVSLKEANDYMTKAKTFGRQIAVGVSLCILSPIMLIILSTISEIKGTISENIATVFGLATLIVLVCLAIAIFILSSLKMKKYEFLDKEDFELEYGVSSIVKEKKESFAGKYTLVNACSIVLIILGVLPLIIVSILTENELTIIYMVALLIFIVSISVHALITVGTIKGSYDRLLCEDDFTKKNTSTNANHERFSGFYWPLITAGYLCWSFISKSWDISWVIWPIAGLLYAGISALFKFDNTNKK